MHGPVSPPQLTQWRGRAFDCLTLAPRGSAHFGQGKAYSTLSNVRVATIVCPVRENVTGVVVIVRFFPLISK